MSSYEKEFLDLYYKKFYPLNDLKNGVEYPIKYIFNNEMHIYLTDYVIPSLNLYIEIKSSWTIEKYQGNDNLNAKEQAVKSSGLNYIMILDKNYSEFNKLILNYKY